MRAVIIVTIVSLLSGNAFAQEVAATEAPATAVATAPVATIPANLQTAFDTVCKSNFVKSPKLQAACATATAPKPLKSGIAFAKPGIGDEVNVLFANMAFNK